MSEWNYMVSSPSLRSSFMLFLFNTVKCYLCVRKHLWLYFNFSGYSFHICPSALIISCLLNPFCPFYSTCIDKFMCTYSHRDIQILYAWVFLRMALIFLLSQVGSLPEQLSFFIDCGFWTSSKIFLNSS